MLTKLTEQEKKDAEEVWGAPSSAWGSYNRIYATYEAGLIAGRAEGAALRKAAEALLEAVMTSRFPIPLWGEWGKELTALRELLFGQPAQPPAAPDYKPVPYEPHDAMQAIRHIEDYLNGPLHEWLKEVARTWPDDDPPPRFEPLGKQAVEEKQRGFKKEQL